ncbi:MAG: N-acetylmuramoyl-L-alanine amidase [Bacteroidota bacterium]
MFAGLVQFFRRMFGMESEPAPTSRSNEPEDVIYEDGSDVFDNSIGETVELPETTTSRSVSRSAGPSANPETGEIIEISDEDLAAADAVVTVSQPRYLWCLDNGHGRLQNGKRSPHFPDGTRFEEWEFNRDIVRLMIEQLQVAGVEYFNVVPEEDTGSFLKGRVDRANAKTSDLGIPKIYVSIHANAAPIQSGQTWANGITGIETFCYPGSKSGRKIARVFQRHLIQTMGWRDRGVKEANFYVLQNTKMSAVLTESGFYTDLQQATDLQTPEVRQQIADAHVAAILEIEANGLENLA